MKPVMNSAVRSAMSGAAHAPKRKINSQLTVAGGFTLIELLLAISIFSVIATISFTTMSTYIDHRERLTNHYGRLQKLQRLFILLERDLQFVINRPVRDDGGDEEEAVLVGENGELIRVTVALPDVQAPTGTSLWRVAWMQDGGQLIRRSWSALDRTSGTDPQETVIDDGIEAVDLQFYTYKPGAGAKLESAESTNDLPAGVEMVLTLEDGQSYRRVFEVAGSVDSGS